MQLPRRAKPYKHKPPRQTIAQIRTILADLNLPTTESLRSNAAGFYSSRVTLIGPGLHELDLGTNGKGITPEYALASAYAELLERLQNCLVATDHLKYATSAHVAATGTSIGHLSSRGLLLDYEFAPDERMVHVDDLLDASRPFFEALTGISEPRRLRDYLVRIENSEQLLCIPYLCHRTRTLVHLPQNLILSLVFTNGSCAGNTRDEAIIQGICELFERYAIRKIFQDSICPPTVSPDHFRGTDILDRITALEKDRHISTVVKDCSLGVGLPVIGALLIDKKRNSYCFRLGADPSPITALERCLTEIFQGVDVFRARFRPLHIEQEILSDIPSARYNRSNALFHQQLSGASYWPRSIFLENPTYEFSGFDHPVSESDAADLRYLLGLIDRNDFHLYLRDSSHLGFPAYFVVIPEISVGCFALDMNLPLASAGWYGIRHILFNLHSSTRSDLETLADNMDAHCAVGYSRPAVHLAFLPNLDADIAALDTDFFLAMLNYKLGRLDRSLDHLRRYIAQNFPDPTTPAARYFACARDYITLKLTPHDPRQLESRLLRYYDSSVVREVLDDLRDPDMVFQYHQLPRCFECESCEVRSTCRYFSVLELYKTIQTASSAKPIDQQLLSTLGEDR
jgi:ribosomal protein S12 methylthiotransferase accessory factor